MQTTFVVTILVGAPLVAVLSAFVPLIGWESWVGFAVRVGALVWFVTALAVYAYARLGGGNSREGGNGNSDQSPPES